MKDVKARLHPTPALQKAVDEYAEEKIKDIQSRAHEAVMKERNDIATRATYLCLLACYQAGLSRRTLVKIQNYMTGPVADKYNEYRNDQLADIWAQVTLQGIGIDAKKSEEPLCKDLALLSLFMMNRWKLILRWKAFQGLKCSPHWTLSARTLWISAFIRRSLNARGNSQTGQKWKSQRMMI